MFMNSSWRRGLRPNRRASTRTRRPCSPTWMERRPTVTCALPPSRRPVLHTLCHAAAKVPRPPGISLPSKPCRTTALSLIRPYAFCAMAASALHAMAVLQVFQAKLLQTAEGGVLTPEATKESARCKRTSRWWRRSERPSLWVRPWALWSSFRGTSG